VVNHRKPFVQTPVVSRYPVPTPVHDFVLLFLPPCGPHLTPLATESLMPSLLVSPLPGGPARHRPFTLALHLHQHKSSHNLHLQYSAKSQSTPRCQSLITTERPSTGPQPSLHINQIPRAECECFICNISLNNLAFWTCLIPNRPLKSEQ
jgi:hypothetical protein